MTGVFRLVFRKLRIHRRSRQESSANIKTRIIQESEKDTCGNGKR